MYTRKRFDSRTQRDRVQRQVQAWRQQIEHLSLQYLEWKCLGPPSNKGGEEDTAEWYTDVMSFGGK